MKTPTLYLLALSLPLSGLPVLAQPSPPPASSAPSGSATATFGGSKTHVLFVGTNLAVERDKAFHQVKDVSGSSFVIARDGRPEFIPANRSSLNVKIEQAMKLTQMSATLANLAVERVYSPGNDPRRKWTKSQNNVDAISQERLAGTQQKWMKMEMFANIPLSTGPDPKLMAELQKAKDAHFQAQESARSEIHNPTYYDRGATEELMAEDFDAMDVTFEVSSPRRLLNPYVVLIVRYREKNAPAGTVRNWIYTKALDPIDAEPRKVHIMEAGFPFGFIVEEYEIHLYDRSEEVATNLSRKRVELTDDEAFQYLVIEHIGRNKGATLKPVPVLGRLPEDFSMRLAAGQGQQTYYVKVSKDGRVVEAFLDETYSKRVDDPYFEAAVKGIRFKPALEKGKPVEGRTAVNLTRLSF